MRSSSSGVYRSVSGSVVVVCACVCWTKRRENEGMVLAQDGRRRGRERKNKNKNDASTQGLNRAKKTARPRAAMRPSHTVDPGRLAPFSPHFHDVCFFRLLAGENAAYHVRILVEIFHFSSPDTLYTTKVPRNVLVYAAFLWRSLRCTVCRVSFRSWSWVSRASSAMVPICRFNNPMLSSSPLNTSNVPCSC